MPPQTNALSQPPRPHSGQGEPSFGSWFCLEGRILDSQLRRDENDDVADVDDSRTLIRDHVAASLSHVPHLVLRTLSLRRAVVLADDTSELELSLILVVPWTPPTTEVWLNGGVSLLN